MRCGGKVVQGSHRSLLKDGRSFRLIYTLKSRLQRCGKWIVEDDITQEAIVLVQAGDGSCLKQIDGIEMYPWEETGFGDYIGLICCRTGYS